MQNQYIEKITNGCPFQIAYDPFGNPASINIEEPNASTSIPIGNDHFPSLLDHIRSTGIMPKPNITTISEVKDSDGKLLHYKTNIGDFVNGKNFITDHIRKLLDNGLVEITEHAHTPNISSIEANIFLPRSYAILDHGMTHVPYFDFHSSDLGLPFSAQGRLLRSIENDRIEEAGYFAKFLKYTGGNVIRINFTGREMRSIFKWSRKILNKEEEKFIASSLEENIALYDRGSRGPTTNWYFDWRVLHHYIWAPILEISNHLIDLINRQAHRKTIGLLSRDDLGDTTILRVMRSDGSTTMWPLSSLRDEQISIFPFQLNWNYHPLEKSFQRVRFLLDRALYFEAILVAQSALEGIVNLMFTDDIKNEFFSGKEPKWETKYSQLRIFIENSGHKQYLLDSALGMYLSGGLREIYELRNHYAHDALEKRPEYAYNSQVMHKTRELLNPLTDTFENSLFMGQVNALHSDLPAFRVYLAHNKGTTDSQALKT